MANPTTQVPVPPGFAQAYPSGSWRLQAGAGIFCESPKGHNQAA